MSSKPQFLMLKGRLINVNKVSSAVVTTQGCTLYYSFQGNGFSNTDILDKDECKKFMNLLVKLDSLHIFPETSK